MKDSTRTGVIYRATVNQKHYIGYTTDFKMRRQAHRQAAGDNHFHRAVRKYGRDTIVWRILASDIPENGLPTYEMFWIRFYDTYHNGYNMTEGGNMSVARYPEVRAKMSVSAKIRQDNLSSDGNHVWQTPESRQRAAQQQLDKIERGEFHLHDPVKRSEWDKRNSELQRERGRRGEHASQRPEVKAKMRRTWVARSAKFGCPLHTPEAQEKLRIRMASPEIREKCRDAALARHARERLEHWEESGQGFLLDMNLDD